MHKMITFRSLTSPEVAYIQKASKECALVDLAVKRATFAADRVACGTGHKLTYTERLAHLDLNLHLLGVK